MKSMSSRPSEQGRSTSEQRTLTQRDLALAEILTECFVHRPCRVTRMTGAWPLLRGEAAAGRFSGTSDRSLRIEHLRNILDAALDIVENDLADDKLTW